MKTSPIDRAHKLLATLGWSFGDMFVGDVWQVYAQRDDDRIVVRAPTQSTDWNEALRQPGIVQRAKLTTWGVV